MSNRSARIFTLLLAIFVTIAIGPGAHARAQESADTLPEGIQPGEIADRVQSLHDPEQTFAVYLPSAYTADRSWPVLFLMDPRGRARVPLEQFRAAAERLGYVLVSSYNTASDTAEDLNTPALEAMLNDSTRMFALDDRRFYLGGFSGTARTVWEFAGQLEESVAGIIGFGGGLPGTYSPPDEAPYGFYGAAGNTDFNYEEMRALDRRLDDGSLAHGFEYFVGGHSWGPEEVCSRALEWMELRAMKTGLRAADTSLAADLYTRRVFEALAWETLPAAASPSRDGAPDPVSGADDPVVDQRAIFKYEAWLRYSALLADFDAVIGRSELDRIVQRIRALEELDGVTAAVALADRLSARHRAFVRELSTVIQEIREGDRQINALELIHYLDLEAIKRQAADLDNPMRALGGQRLIESVFVQVAFYQPRDFLARGDPEAVLEFLGVADFIRPGTFNVLLHQARAHALHEDVGQAVEALRGAQTIRDLDPSVLDDDPYFDSIRQTPEFRELIGQLRTSTQ